MVGTETDADACAWAERNAAAINVPDVREAETSEALEGTKPKPSPLPVRILRVSPDAFLADVLGSDAVPRAAFTVCNPPFFGTAERAEDQHPDRAREGTRAELVHEHGGELGFVGRLLEDSAALRDRCVWFTSLLGHKASLAPLSARARALGASLVRSTCLRQGHTFRWALAWTFFPALHFRPIDASVALLRAHRVHNIDRREALRRVRQSLREAAGRSRRGRKRPRPDGENDADEEPGGDEGGAGGGEGGGAGGGVVGEEERGDAEEEVEGLDGEVTATVDTKEETAAFVVRIEAHDVTDEGSLRVEHAAPLEPPSDAKCTISFHFLAGTDSARRGFQAWVAHTMTDVLRTGRRWRRRTEREAH
jgi:RNA methyltransferase